MYAVISSGGKQYRVAEGETLRVEKLAGAAGTKVTFGPLLFADDGGGVQVGQPTVKGVTVEAEIVDQGLAQEDHHLQVQAPQELPPQGRATASRSRRSRSPRSARAPRR